jgi:hypothetical protein
MWQYMPFTKKAVFLDKGYTVIASLVKETIKWYAVLLSIRLFGWFQFDLSFRLITFSATSSNNQRN